MQFICKGGTAGVCVSIFYWMRVVSACLCYLAHFHQLLHACLSVLLHILELVNPLGVFLICPTRPQPGKLFCKTTTLTLNKHAYLQPRHTNTVSCFLKKSIMCFLNPNVSHYLLLYLNYPHLFKPDMKSKMVFFSMLSQLT